MRIILSYKSFTHLKHVSHIGLGVAALNSCKTLQKNRIHTEVWPIQGIKDLEERLKRDSGEPRISHVVISALWAPTHELSHLCLQFPRIEFTIVSHSNVAFLQGDTRGMLLLREALELDLALPNFSVAANSRKMSRWIEDCYGNRCETLPNLYYLHDVDRHPHHWNGGLLKIGSFGAIRPQKNLASAVGAALELSFQLKTETQIWISSGRTEAGGHPVVNTIRAMCEGIPNVTLREAGWLSWPKFRRLVGSMNLLIQPSHTESFSMVTGDAVAELTPIAGAPSITWLPHHWQANPDDVFDIARVGRHLLRDHAAPAEGLHALKKYISEGVECWKHYIRKTTKEFQCKILDQD